MQKSFFIKVEKFKDSTILLPLEQRKEYIHAHKVWVNQLKENGINISSGYLVDKLGAPGGGGLLILEANTFQEAKLTIEKDPIIVANLVNWELHEWIYTSGEKITKLI